VRVVLDSNTWDQLAHDGDARVRVAALVDSGELVVVVPATLRRELVDSPFRRVPDWFPVEVVLDGVTVLGHSRLGESRLGDGVVFGSHRGQSHQVADAVIVDTAHSCADLYVSEDRRARTRYATISDGSRSLTYAEFRVRILDL
jgi:hypothetical protein